MEYIIIRIDHDAYDDIQIKTVDTLKEGVRELREFYNDWIDLFAEDIDMSNSFENVTDTSEYTESELKKIFEEDDKFYAEIKFKDKDSWYEMYLMVPTK